MKQTNQCLFAQSVIMVKLHWHTTSLIIESFGVFSCHLEPETTVWNYIKPIVIFTNRIVDIWNSVPAAVVFSHNAYSFKRRLT